MTEDIKDDQASWPAEQRDYVPGEVMWEKTTYQLHYQEPDGRWMLLGAAKESRDEMTLVQTDRARRYPEEKRRIAQETVTVTIDEVEGDGEGETSREALFARNEEATKRLLGE